MENKTNGLDYFTIICNLKDEERIISLLQENNAYEITIIYGQGSIKQGVIQSSFGLEIESKKAIINCLLKKETSIDIIRAAISDRLRIPTTIIDANNGTTNHAIP